MGSASIHEVQKSVTGASVPAPQSLPGYQSASSTQCNCSDLSVVDERLTDLAPQEVPVGRSNPKKIIYFNSDDPENPANWSEKKKRYIFVTGILIVINSTVGSSIPSGAVSFIAKTFDITEEIQLPLPMSCFLFGYVIGPSICAPLSEHVGRKPVLLGFFSLAMLFSMACALAPNWPALLIFRLVCGVGLSAPIAIVGGLYADVYTDPRQRGVAMAWFTIATTLGPIISPIISGFISENTTWRWVFGVEALFAAATLPLMLLMPETYVPALLSRKARKLRNETGDPEIVAKTELEKKTLRHVLTVVMTRPYRMLFSEVIVMCVAAYCSLAYGIFYLYFEAYPIIFQGPDSVYKWSWGLSGLAFLPIGMGVLLAAPVFLMWDAYLAKAQKRNAKWSFQEEYRRLPLAILGGPLYVVSLLWIGWSAKPGMHWMAPITSGVTFGMGFVLIFMALLNYLSDSYMTFAASAQGVASQCRSVAAALLPLASHRMFSSLGISWACTLLAFLSLGMCPIPFAFIKFGDQIRDKSSFCKQLKEMQRLETAEQEEREHVSVVGREGDEGEKVGQPDGRRIQEMICEKAV